jgi:LysR family hydrogen peroxide-inducible transcriptional activator
MIMAGIGVTLLPALAVQGMGGASEHIHLLTFEDARPSRSIALVWRRSSALLPLLRQIAEVCRAISPSLLDTREAAPA